ncbi:MAG: hypothetical protein IM521_19300 [Microcystis sp. M27BS1]|nr:hypothetical protein [Microcystis sp. M27BS1]
MLQNLCQLGILLSVILGGLCTYGSSYFNRKKEQLKRVEVYSNIDTSKKQGDVYNISGDYINEQKNTKSKKETIIAPSALIVTKDQKGGQNTVNVYGAINPANKENKPLFDDTGYFGENILKPDLISLTKEKDYSFTARIPDNSKLKVRLVKIGVDKSPQWVMGAFNAKSWRWSRYNNILGEQEYELDEPKGDLQIIFKETGTASLEIFFNGELLSSKLIKWK